MVLLRVEDISRVYPLGGRGVAALRGISFEVSRGEFVSIMGPSGSGKSTLLNILGCLDRPTEGSYFIEDRDVSVLGSSQLADLRGGVIGFVFQTFNLIPTLTARENVEVPLLYRGVGASERRRLAMQVLDEVGIADRSDHLPSELSGGEQQRTAVARALVTNPVLILADEPTGNLDSKASKSIMGLFQRINEEHGVTIIQVTHDSRMALYGTRMIRFTDGKIVGDHSVTERLRADDPRASEDDEDGEGINTLVSDGERRVTECFNEQS
ncbi:MAG: ABC transporter ATP-binding protein [Bacillota bacterium]